MVHFSSIFSILEAKIILKKPVTHNCIWVITKCQNLEKKWYNSNEMSGKMDGSLLFRSMGNKNWFLKIQNKTNWKRKRFNGWIVMKIYINILTTNVLYHIETSQLISNANQLIGNIGVVNGLTWNYIKEQIIRAYLSY